MPLFHEKIDLNSPVLAVLQFKAQHDLRCHLLFLTHFRPMFTYG